jgi:hypothetical protein
VHAVAPLHVQLPAEHWFVEPVHCESAVQAVQPVAVQVVPAPQAVLPLHVHVPDVQVFVDPLQSAPVQQLPLEMQEPAQSF